MKTEALQELGLTEDQIKEIMKANGKDIEAVKKRAETAEADRDQYKARAEAAEETLKGFDGVDVDQMKQTIEDYKKKAEQADAEYQQQIYERDFSDALKAELESVKFSSEAAKRSVMNDIKAADLKLKDGKILGLNDLIGQIREKDASAFAADANGNEPAKFTDPSKNPPANPGRFSKMTLVEKMKYANEHPNSADVIEWLRKD